MQIIVSQIIIKIKIKIFKNKKLTWRRNKAMVAMKAM